MKKIDLHQLSADPTTLVQDLGYDARLEGYDPEITSSAELSEKMHFVGREHRTVPFETPIIMHGPLRYLQGKDILRTQPSYWIVISPKFRKLLEEMSAVEQQFIPVRIYDGEVRPGDDLTRGATRYTDEYSLLYLPETLKIFDYYESEYSFGYINKAGSYKFVKSNSLMPEKIPELEAENADVGSKKTVLKLREDELPDYFRLPIESIMINVTQKGRDKFTQSGINNLL